MPLSAACPSGTSCPGPNDAHPPRKRCSGEMIERESITPLHLLSQNPWHGSNADVLIMADVL